MMTADLHAYAAASAGLIEFLPRASASSIDQHLGLTKLLSSGLRCGEVNVAINLGTAGVIEMGGGSLGTMHARAQIGRAHV